MHIIPPRVELRGRKVSIIFVHESGHALAYLVTGLAWGQKNPIERIDISLSTDEGDPDIFATTYHPTWPPAMVAASKSQYPNGFSGTDLTIYRNVINASRDAGIDVERWARDFMLGCVAGPIAEAIYLGEGIDTVLYSARGRGDRANAGLAFCAWKDCEDLEEAHEIEFMSVVGEEVARGTALVKRNRRAITALALALPRKGSFPGERASELLLANLAEPDRRTLDERTIRGS